VHARVALNPTSTRTCAVAELEARAAAVRLQVAFIGALGGSLLSVTAFVEDAFHCYRCGARLLMHDLSTCEDLKCRYTSSLLPPCTASITHVPGQEVAGLAAFLELKCCGREGLSAQAVFDQLQPQELLQSGIVLPIAGMGSAEETTSALLAQWLSTAYIALAQACRDVAVGVLDCML